MGGATFAAFSSQATSANNTFATGTADLLIAEDVSGNPGTFGSSITGPNFTGMLPGDSKDFLFWLKNGSTSPTSLALTADVSAINSAANALDDSLLVSWTCDTNFNNSLGDETATSEFSPRDWLDGGSASIVTLPQSQQMYCKITGRLPSTADNTVSGMTVDFDAIYDGVQTP